jgi:hypothetical protein
MVSEFTEVGDFHLFNPSKCASLNTWKNLEVGDFHLFNPSKSPYRRLRRTGLEILVVKGHRPLFIFTF